VRVLGVGAHPDDLEILAGGTLARYVREGHEVVMCHMTTGNAGSIEIPAAELVGIRSGEARRAAEIAGAEYRALGLGDGTIDASSPDQKLLVVDLIREVRPNVIITHYPDDYMRDHNETASLVWDCAFLSALKNFESSREYYPEFVPIYHMDTIGGLHFDPAEFVDVTDVIDVKVAMLSAHESQVGYYEDNDPDKPLFDLVDNMKALTRLRGVQCGVDWAEGFIQCTTWARPVPHRLLPP
jgi:LmbE family N-acetylglucosaminyl deacetylase